MRPQHNHHLTVFDLVTATPSDPAAGTYSSYQTPPNSLIQVLSISFLYTASATVLDRLPHVYLRSGSDSVLVTLAKDIITASEAITCHFSLSITGENVTASHSLQYAALADSMFAIDGEYVRAWAFPMDGTDQISDVVIRTKQWISQR